MSCSIDANAIGISHRIGIRIRSMLMSRRAVYTGSFDPITLGHLNVIERSSRLVDELIVGIGINIDKQSLFTADERVELIRPRDRTGWATSW